MDETPMQLSWVMSLLLLLVSHYVANAIELYVLPVLAPVWSERGYPWKRCRPTKSAREEENEPYHKRNSNHPDVAWIDLKEVEELHGSGKSKVILLDCRFPHEFQQGRVPQSFNVWSVSGLKKWWQQLLQVPVEERLSWRTLTLVFYSTTSGNKAASMLRCTRALLMERCTAVPIKCYLLNGGIKTFCSPSESQSSLRMAGRLVTKADFPHSINFDELFAEATTLQESRELQNMCNDFIDEQGLDKNSDPPGLSRSVVHGIFGKLDTIHANSLHILGVDYILFLDSRSPMEFSKKSLVGSHNVYNRHLALKFWSDNRKEFDDKKVAVVYFCESEKYAKSMVRYSRYLARKDGEKYKAIKFFYLTGGFSSVAMPFVVEGLVCTEPAPDLPYSEMLRHIRDMMWFQTCQEQQRALMAERKYLGVREMWSEHRQNSSKFLPTVIGDQTDLDAILPRTLLELVELDASTTGVDHYDILDVRTSDEFAAGRIVDSRNIWRISTLTRFLEDSRAHWPRHSRNVIVVLSQFSCYRAAYWLRQLKNLMPPDYPQLQLYILQGGYSAVFRKKSLRRALCGSQADYKRLTQCEDKEELEHVRLHAPSAHFELLMKKALKRNEERKQALRGSQADYKRLTQCEDKEELEHVRLHAPSAHVGLLTRKALKRNEEWEQKLWESPREFGGTWEEKMERVRKTLVREGHLTTESKVTWTPYDMFPGFLQQLTSTEAVKGGDGAQGMDLDPAAGQDEAMSSTATEDQVHKTLIKLPGPSEDQIDDILRELRQLEPVNQQQDELRVLQSHLQDMKELVRKRSVKKERTWLAEEAAANFLEGEGLFEDVPLFQYERYQRSMSKEEPEMAAAERGEENVYPARALDPIGTELGLNAEPGLSPLARAALATLSKAIDDAAAAEAAARSKTSGSLP